MARLTTEGRFWSYVQKSEDGCWLWSASCDPFGYGQFGINGSPIRAHRVAYILTNGPVPDGRHIHHICENRSCVRPSHLECVTPQEHKDRHREADASTPQQRREALERAVALAGSLSAAARAEGTTRQAVQQRIARLGGNVVTETAQTSRIVWETIPLMNPLTDAEKESARARLERAVALSGSLSAAARAEKVTRQALQQRIRRLGGRVVTELTQTSRIEWGTDPAAKAA